MSYIDDEVQTQQATVTRSSDRDSELFCLASFLEQFNTPQSLIVKIVGAADEMLSNAFYNAHVNDQGDPRHEDSNQPRGVALRASDHVHLSYGFGRGVFGISVRDPFGCLTHKHLSESICSSDSNTTESAQDGALGFLLIARSAHQFVVNVAPGECTEVIALWSLDRRSRRQSHHSLHFFEASRSKPVRSRYAQGTLQEQPRGAKANGEIGIQYLPKPSCGQPLDVPQQTLDIRTMMGLLRAGHTEQDVIETSLRFLSTPYTGVIAFKVREGGWLEPHKAMGHIHDWEALRGMAINVAAPTTLTRVLKSERASRFRMLEDGLDHELSLHSTGGPRAQCAVIPVYGDKQLRYAIYAFGLRYHGPISNQVLERLEDQIQRSIEILRTQTLRERAVEQLGASVPPSQDEPTPRWFLDIE